MYVKIAYHEDMWKEIKQNALFTEHKFEEGKYPSSKWKKQMLLCEHSPIRTGMIIVEVHDVPVFVIDHFVRHHVGFTPFVSSLRDDRNEFPEGYIPNRETLNSMRFEGNFQAFINISRKRLCNKAHAETKKVWEAVVDEIAKVEPELASVMVPECVYRGFCPERRCCGFWGTSGFKLMREAYVKDSLEDYQRIFKS